MTPADRIDTIIKERGLSRRQVAINAEIPPSTFQSAMERKKNMSSDMLKKIAKVLGVSLSDLLSDEETSTTNKTGSVPDNVAVAVACPPGYFKEILLHELEKMGVFPDQIKQESSRATIIGEGFIVDDLSPVQAEKIAKRITEILNDMVEK